MEWDEFGINSNSSITSIELLMSSFKEEWVKFKEDLHWFLAGSFETDFLIQKCKY